MDCHPAEEMVKQAGHKQYFATADSERGYCTDCHGSHRLEVRTRRWDKDTGKLIESDGVSMYQL